MNGHNTFKEHGPVPGSWVDVEGCLHIDVPRLLQLAGFEDTPENRALAMELLKRESANNGVTAIERALPDPELRQPIRGYEVAKDGNSILCLRCGSRSWNFNDIRFCYCAVCKVFHEDVVSPALR